MKYKIKNEIYTLKFQNKKCATIGKYLLEIKEIMFISPGTILELVRKSGLIMEQEYNI